MRRTKKYENLQQEIERLKAENDFLKNQCSNSYFVPNNLKASFDKNVELQFFSIDLNGKYLSFDSLHKKFIHDFYEIELNSQCNIFKIDPINKFPGFTKTELNELIKKQKNHFFVDIQFEMKPTFLRFYLSPMFENSTFSVILFKINAGIKFFNDFYILNELFENIPDRIYFKDQNFNYVKLNKAQKKFLNIQDEKQVIGKKDIEINPSEYSSQKEEDERRLIFSGKPIIDKIYRYNDKKNNNNVRWISSSKIPIFDHNSIIVGMAGISRDITNQKIKHDDDLLQQLMDNIPDTIYFKDLQGRFTRINKAQAKMLGIEKTTDAIGKTDFDFFNEEHAKNAYEDEQKIILTGTPLLDKEERIILSNGQQCWVSATKVITTNPNGNVTGIVGISRNITERKNAEEILKKAKQKAEEADKMKSDFLANMSHEIRTPMNAIIGFSDLLLDSQLSEKQRNIYIDYIKSSGKSLLNLINDIIDVSKIEAGKIKIQKEDCEIHAILNELHAAYTQQKDRKGKENVTLKLKNYFQEKELVIETDPFRFRQIIANLLSNAIKFVDKGFIQFGYKLKDNENLLFFVKDTGVGIPKEKQKNIFDRFGQVEDTYKRNQTGTGLGLAICSKLTQLLGGEIWVDSDEGMGATFYFTLPFKRGIEKEKQTEKTHLQDFKSLDWSNKIILVAEDELMNYKLIEVVLRKTKIKILWAKNGQEALQFVKKNNIDIILMDLKMPQMDGYEATQIIRKENKDIPIIAQSAFAMAGEKKKCLTMGFNNYISKPFKANEIIQLIYECF